MKANTAVSKLVPIVLSFVASVALLPGTVFAAYYGCAYSKPVPPTISKCNCNDGSCPGSEYNLNGYTKCYSAVYGYHSSQTPIFLGNRFPCTSSWNIPRLIACYGAAGACGLGCALSFPVVGPGAFLCLLACGTGLGTGCLKCDLVSCNVASTGVPETGIDCTLLNSCPSP